MNRSDLAKALVHQSEGVSASDAEKILAALPKVMHTELQARGEFVLNGLGRFHVADVAAKPERPGRNPRTGEPMTIAAQPAKKAIRFKAGAAMKVV